MWVRSIGTSVFGSQSGYPGRSGAGAILRLGDGLGVLPDALALGRAVPLEPVWGEADGFAEEFGVAGVPEPVCGLPEAERAAEADGRDEGEPSRSLARDKSPSIAGFTATISAPSAAPLTARRASFFSS